MANKYQKQFHIFKNMDNDVGNPSGYIKVEINGVQAKLQLSLNNLLASQGVLYQLYGINKHDNELNYSKICDIPNVNGRADIRLNMDTSSIGSCCLPLDDINIYAVIVYINGNASKPICPLVAYTKQELNWRSEFDRLVSINERGLVNNSPSNFENYGSRGQDINTKSIESTRASSIEDISLDSSDDSDANKISEEGKIFTPDNLSEQCQNTSSEIEKSVDNIKADDLSPLNDMDRDNSCIHGGNDAIEEQINVETRENIKLDDNDGSRDSNIAIENGEFNKHSTKGSSGESCINYTEIEDDRKANLQPHDQLFNDIKFNSSGKFESIITSIYNGDRASTITSIYNNSTAPDICEEPETKLEDTFENNDILESVEKNFNDISSIGMDKTKNRTELNLAQLKDELDKSFESYNPFKIKSKNFIWWKINSPGYLNNILFRNNVRTYLLFNPKVMLAHYKYRYIIFGIRLDRRSGKEYFVCGVPGVYRIDENPFGSVGSWAQTEGFKPKYGAFGYWTIMIDPKTGKLIKVR